MVVIHDYSRPDPSMPSQEESSEPPQYNEIDDEKAFVIGLWVISGIVILIVLGIVLKATLFTSKKSPQPESTPQVMGEQTQQEVTQPAQTQTEAPSILPVDSQTTNTGESKKAEELKATIPGSTIYTVESGDTISGIGKKMGVAWKKIAEINGISSPYSLHPGQKLVIPPKEK